MNTASTFQKIVNAHVTPYLFGFLGWQLMWQLQTQLAVLDYALGISLMFLPAGIRTLAVLIFGLRGAVGVFVGAVFSTIEYLGHIPTMDLANVVLIAAISAFSAYLMMQLVCWWRRIRSDETGPWPSAGAETRPSSAHSAAGHAFASVAALVCPPRECARFSWPGSGLCARTR